MLCQTTCYLTRTDGPKRSNVSLKECLLEWFSVLYWMQLIIHLFKVIRYFICEVLAFQIGYVLMLSLPFYRELFECNVGPIFKSSLSMAYWENDGKINCMKNYKIQVTKFSLSHQWIFLILKSIAEILYPLSCELMIVTCHMRETLYQYKTATPFLYINNQKFKQSPRKSIC